MRTLRTYGLVSAPMSFILLGFPVSN